SAAQSLISSGNSWAGRKAWNSAMAVNQLRNAWRSVAESRRKESGVPSFNRSVISVVARAWSRSFAALLEAREKQQNKAVIAQMDALRLVRLFVITVCGCTITTVHTVKSKISFPVHVRLNVPLPSQSHHCGLCTLRYFSWKPIWRSQGRSRNAKATIHSPTQITKQSMPINLPCSISRILPHSVSNWYSHERSAVAMPFVEGLYFLIVANRDVSKRTRRMCQQGYAFVSTATRGRVAAAHGKCEQLATSLGRVIIYLAKQIKITWAGFRFAIKTAGIQPAWQNPVRWR